MIMDRFLSFLRSLVSGQAVFEVLQSSVSVVTAFASDSQEDSTHHRLDRQLVSLYLSGFLLVELLICFLLLDIFARLYR